MISFGPVWETKLKELWKESSLSLSEIGRRLGVDPVTVRRHAARLNLPSSSYGRKSKPIRRENQLKGNTASHELHQKRRTYRSRWISVTAQHPEVTLKEMRHKLPREYAWLMQNDSEWLKKHRHSSRRRAFSKSGVKWKKRDAQYAADVLVAAASLKNKLGRPVQVTRTAIGRAISAVTLLRQKLYMMPMTAQVLASAVETRVEYALRRIRWAAECFIHDRIMPRPWQLVLRANVYSLREVLEVKTALGAVLRLIEFNLSLKQKLTA